MELTKLNSGYARVVLCLKIVRQKLKKRIVFRIFIVENQTDNDKTILNKAYQQSYRKSL